MNSKAVDQSKKRHYLFSGFILLSVAALISVLWIALKMDPKATPQALIGKSAKTFTGEWLQGSQHIPEAPGTVLSLEHIRGRPIVVNFWASWCMSCREEAAVLEAYWQKHRDSELKIIGIAVQDTREAAVAFARKFGKTYPLILDTDGSAGINYGVTGVPETFFIARNGTIAGKITGPVAPDSMEKWIGEIMK